MSNVKASLFRDTFRDLNVLLASCVVCGTQGHWTIEDFVREHRHEYAAPPRPLTPEERERVVIQGIHRRGALRVTYGRPD